MKRAVLKPHEVRRIRGSKRFRDTRARVKRQLLRAAAAVIAAVCLIGCGEDVSVLQQYKIDPVAPQLAPPKPYNEYQQRSAGIQDAIKWIACWEMEIGIFGGDGSLEAMTERFRFRWLSPTVGVYDEETDQTVVVERMPRFWGSAYQDGAYSVMVRVNQGVPIGELAEQYGVELDARRGRK